MTSLEQYLTQRFSGLGQNLNEITSAFAPMSIKKGTHFLEAGKKCQHIAFIESGVMRNYHIDERGNEVVNYMTCEGEFNTVYKYFQSQEVCPEHIQAVTDCELRVISLQQFQQLKQELTVFQRLIEELVMEGLNCKEERLQAYLTQDAQKRYEHLIKRQPQVVQYSPLQYIASYLGITRETLSRIRNRKPASA